MGSTRRFLGWDRPLLELAGEALLREATPPRLDLSHLLVVTPTKNAGRRLREMLAHLAHEQGRAICPPQVVPPEYLLGLISDPDQHQLATPEETLLAWVRVVRGANLDQYRALFPIEPVAQDFHWALSTAVGLMDLRNTLGEAGLEIADVPRLVGDRLEEEDRWHELARLERQFQYVLRGERLIDILSVRKDRALTPDVPDGIERIWLIGCPDPIPLAVEVLGAMSSIVPVEVLVHAPKDLAAEFDGWGRPVVDRWLQREIGIPGFDERLRILPTPAAQAEVASQAVLAYERPAASVTVGVLDPEVTPPLERRLTHAGQAVFNPQGSSLRSRGVVHLLRMLRDLLRDRSYRAFIELLHCPDFTAYLSQNIIFWETPRAFERFDEFYQQHLPQDLKTLRRFLRQGRQGQTEVTLEQLTALEEIEKLIHKLAKSPLEETLPDLLHQIFSARAPIAGGEVERALRAVADRLQPVLDAIASPLGSALQLEPAEGLDLLIHQLENEILYEERTADAVELLGWLELPWDDAPHLILTGLNDGFAPEAIVGDIYLPESLRRTLAGKVPFTTNELRLARDIYLLEAMLQSRAARGRVDLCFGKRSQNGDPLRPSRLLFRCPDESLPERAVALFRETSLTESSLPWTPGFTLTPPRAAETGPCEVESLSVTAFRDYLTSPFHFYLRHIERMSGVDTGLTEMAALTFGNFCHEVLRQFGRDPDIRQSTDVEAVREFLARTAEELAFAWFGPEPALPIRIQLYSAQQRLARAAEVQVRDRRDGWLIHETEAELGDGEWTIDGIRIRGRIDRIDRHEITGQIRVLDYKTSDQPNRPDRAHCTRLSASARLPWLPSYARFELDGKSYRWKDLQLPLYRLGLDASHGNDVLCGYFNLPKAISETGIEIWGDFTPAQDEAALHCARGILKDVLAGRFWPAVPTRFGDPYESVHLDLPEQTVNAARLVPSPEEVDLDLHEEIANPASPAVSWTVSAVLVEEGDDLQSGEEILELTADNRICVLQASRSGTVTRICVEPGDPIRPGETVCLQLRQPASLPVS